MFFCIGFFGIVFGFFVLAILVRYICFLMLVLLAIQTVVPVFLYRERHAKYPEDTLSNPRCRAKTIFRRCACFKDAFDAHAQPNVFECFVCKLSALEFAFPFVTLYPTIIIASFRVDERGRGS